ncbi:unnamed protein product [Arabis nemorensis]|uniref:Uncharacterized protein n=1 Tax=Arabis nemorensis TaxID=586526 RepID=A0A565BDY7_9BRAS|nr:unnamed protein product [Arabis nemorensis]
MVLQEGLLVKGCLIDEGLGSIEWCVWIQFRASSGGIRAVVSDLGYCISLFG